MYGLTMDKSSPAFSEKPPKMFARVIAVALVASKFLQLHRVLGLTCTVVTLVNGIANGTGIARGPGNSPMTIGASCPAQVCGCMPKMCTDLAIISGTAMQLTYICPETKTVEVTETIWVTIHDHGSMTAIASLVENPSGFKHTHSNLDSTTVDDKTTTLTDTRKSTLYVTKTVKSTMHHIHDSSSMTAAASLVENPYGSQGLHSNLDSTTVDEKTTTVTGTRKSTLYVTKTIQSKHSSATGGTSYTTVGNSTVANVTHPVSTRPGTVGSTDLVSILPVFTESSHRPLILTNPLRTSLSSPSSLSWSYIWRTTTTGVVAEPAPSSEQGSKVISSSSGTAAPSTVDVTSSLGNGYSTSAVSHANVSTVSYVLPPPGHSHPSRPSATNKESESTSLYVLPPPGHSHPSGPSPTDKEPGSTTSYVLPPPGHSRPSSPSATDKESDSSSSYLLPPPGHSKSLSPSITDMESFPNIGEPTGFISLPPDSEIFTSIFDGATDDFTDTPETLTDGTYFSSELPMYPTAFVRRNHIDNHTYAGTISMVITTTTVTLQEAASAVTSIETQQVTTTETHGSFSPGNERVSQGNVVDTASGYCLYLLPILFLVFLAL